MTTAFVLSGGASLGAIQVGMLQALSREGIRPDLIIGASVGAVNAAWLAGDPSPESMDRLADVWRKIDRDDVFPFQPLRGFLGFLGRQPSLLSAIGLRRLVERNLAFDRLEDAPIEVHTVVVDVLTGRDTLLSTGDAADAIVASAAIPGVFPPVLIDGRPYIDGGVVNNTPISYAHELGADEIWVLAAGYPCALPEAPGSALGMALHGLNLLIQHRLAADVDRYEPLVDLRVVPPLCPVTVSPADFGQADDLIERARTGTERWVVDPQRPEVNQSEMLVGHGHD